jgi:hypothetical protein
MNKKEMNNDVACIDCEVMEDTIRDIKRQTRIQVLYEIEKNIENICYKLGKTNYNGEAYIIMDYHWKELSEEIIKEIKKLNKGDEK